MISYIVALEEKTEDAAFDEEVIYIEQIRFSDAISACMHKDYLEQTEGRTGIVVKVKNNSEDLISKKNIDDFVLLYSKEMSTRILSDQEFEDEVIEVIEKCGFYCLSTRMIQEAVEKKLNLPYSFNPKSFREKLLRICKKSERLFIFEKGKRPYSVYPYVFSLKNYTRTLKII